MSAPLQGHHFAGQLNSVQLNIVTFVNVAGALATQSLEGNLFMRDNSPLSGNQGTSRLQTTCRQGQALNWIILPLDSAQRADKSWPPMPKITNIVFLNSDRSNVAEGLVCTQFGIYGGPDKMRSPSTPVYYYWAGTVLPRLDPGVYPYRFVIELPEPRAPYQIPGAAQSIQLNLEGPSLQVIRMDAGKSTATDPS
ncbi:MAG TPA: hypothetical protein VEO54_22675 [Thermoanaerobaculia bacterium]|nr:hypothetical protein [Thermoanaerobaculia bacterium]